MRAEVAPRITVDPATHHGTAVIAGTRVPVSIVIGSLAGGMSEREIAAEYAIAVEDIKAALSFAADLVAQTVAIETSED